MTRFFIERSQNTPLVKFEEGVMLISGRCIPENALLFFEPVFKFISDYGIKPDPMTELNIMLEYANSSTNRSLMTIFTLFEKIYENDNNVSINWFYESGDDLMYELGVDFKALLRIPFSIHERESLKEK